jgi:hypothetical protein
MYCYLGHKSAWNHVYHCRDSGVVKCQPVEFGCSVLAATGSIPMSAVLQQQQ